MPRKRTTCARGAGHPPGQHATAEAMENHRVRRRGRVRNDTPEVKAKWRLTHKLKRYGLTQDDFDRMLEEQDYACAMCPTLFEAGDLVFIDHDHTLGCHPGEKSACDRCRRGLLCLRCNVAVGYIEKYGVMARAYLEKTATPKPQRPEGRRLGAISATLPQMLFIRPGCLDPDGAQPVPADRLERLYVLVAHQVRDRLVVDAPVVHDRRERVPHAVDVELAEPGITEDDLDAPPARRCQRCPSTRPLRLRKLVHDLSAARDNWPDLMAVKVSVVVVRPPRSR